MDLAAEIGRAVFGAAVLLTLLYWMSEKRARIDWRLVAVGLGLQVALALCLLKWPFFQDAMEGVSIFFYTLIQFSNDGARMMFGELPFDARSFGIAFTVLSTIIFFSALSAVLYHLRILQCIVYAFAWLLSKSLRLSGAECLAAAANVFVGQTEAPLAVKPYLKSMGRSEIMCLMTGGMATIAGGVLAIYMDLLGGGDKESAIFFGQHLLTASILSAPAAMVTAKLISPQVEALDTTLSFPKEVADESLLGAATRGTSEGLKLALNVGAMLIAFTALIALLNWTVAEGVGSWTGMNEWVAEATGGRFQAFNFSFILGLLSAPFAFILGVPGEDILLAGQLLGERLALNEFVAYVRFSQLREAGMFADEKSMVIMAYALCGFANIASVGIQVGGIGALEPSQRKTLLSCGMKAMLGGVAACYMTAIVASLFV